MDENLTTDGGVNSNPLYCRHCGSQFLDVKKAQRVENEMSQSHLQRLNDASSTEVSSSFWQVNDMWDFDNFGQSRPVGVSASADPNVTPETVYVVCADCEKGPVGVRWRAGEPYYVSHSLIVYEPKEGAPANGALPTGMSEDFIRQLMVQREAQGGGEAEEAPVVVVEEEAAVAPSERKEGEEQEEQPKDEEDTEAPKKN
eukprot:CAMPEP_0178544682 /NCGR_PEP_ID=MMETSP0697-20121206/3246_1 /TAXON_ID=265572 /ORGANISM="Extubocellulus spinifer, Strain CCMP396" /LENGTH=199 /DNA_ID=CAMNT_0020177213 /DNA_START=11 /DNA_END=610 /DNA_ORIENTATION=-